MIGFHIGPAGNANGLEDYFARLDAAGIPAVIKATDTYGPCHQLAQLARASGVEHQIFFRLTTAGQNDGYDYDVPNYDHPNGSDVAMYEHWHRTLDKLPPEFDRSLVWLEIMNEVDKNRSEWLAVACFKATDLALDQGFKTSLLAWSSGEPEPEHWRGPNMLALLQRAANYPNQLAIAVHEYTLDQEKTLQEADRWWIGRYKDIYAALEETCTERSRSNGITGRPTIHVTEGGWSLNWVPAPSAGLPQLDWAYKKYYGPDRVPFALWNLGGGNNQIANRVQPYILPLTRYLLDNYIPEDDRPPDPPPKPEPDPIVDILQRIKELADEGITIRNSELNGVQPLTNS